MIKFYCTAPNPIHISSVFLILAHWNVPKWWSCPPKPESFLWFIPSFVPNIQPLSHAHSICYISNPFFTLYLPDITVNRKAEETGFRNGLKPKPLEFKVSSPEKGVWFIIHSSTNHGSCGSQHLMVIGLGSIVLVRLFLWCELSLSFFSCTIIKAACLWFLALTSSQNILKAIFRIVFVKYKSY